MKVLVTGHLGFIGPVMIRAFKEHGHHITGLDIGFFKECTEPGGEWPAPDAEIVKDIRDVSLDDVDGCDAIVHLAALSNDPLGELDEKLTYQINHLGTIELAKKAKQVGVQRFVLASSCSIYGSAGTKGPLDETARLNPVSAYAVSKVESEHMLSEMADENFSPVFLRNGTAYGVSNRTRLDLVLNNLVAWGYTTQNIKVMSDGTPWRPLVHIEDISGAALAAIEAERMRIHNQAFNVGRADSNYQISEIAEVVARELGDVSVEITRETGGDPRSYRVDFSKIQEQLPEFQPRWTLEKGAEELHKWMVEGGLFGHAFDSRHFIRLGQLKHLKETGVLDDRLRLSPGAAPLA